mmetsp:Transcript_96251/g.272069  ORF Transcript_96251/g.272069 Transcript_96251/m.272069 type:complete len:210 (-) Transcript_96251:42-671(-)
MQDVVVRGFVESVQLILDVCTHALRPIRVAVSQIPLVAHGDDTLVPGPGDHATLGLEIRKCLATFDQIAPDEWLRVHDLLAGIWPLEKHPRIKSFLVNFLFRLGELVFLLVRADLQLFAQVRRSRVAILRMWYLDGLHHTERLTPILLDAELLAPIRPRLPIVEARIVVWRIRWDAGDDTGALFHRNRQHRQHVNGVKGGKRSLQRKPE